MINNDYKHINVIKILYINEQIIDSDVEVC